MACAKYYVLIVLAATHTRTVAQHPLDVANALAGQAVWVSGSARGTNATCGLVQGDTTCSLDTDAGAPGGVACGATEACQSLDCVNDHFTPYTVRVLSLSPATIIGDATVTAGTATFAGGGRIEAALPPAAQNGPLQYLAFSAWLRADPGLPQT